MGEKPQQSKKQHKNALYEFLCLIMFMQFRTLSWKLIQIFQGQLLELFHENEILVLYCWMETLHCLLR